MTTIYALLDPRSNGIRYVGRTVDAEARYRQHLASPTSDVMRVWLAALAEEGLLPVMEQLDTCEDVDADKTETLWIRKLAASGALLNTAKMRAPTEPQAPSEYEAATVVDDPTEREPSVPAAFFLREEAALSRRMSQPPRMRLNASSADGGHMGHPMTEVRAMASLEALCALPR